MSAALFASFASTPALAIVANVTSFFGGMGSMQLGVAAAVAGIGVAIVTGSTRGTKNSDVGGDMSAALCCDFLRHQLREMILQQLAPAKASWMSFTSASFSTLPAPKDDAMYAVESVHTKGVTVRDKITGVSLLFFTNARSGCSKNVGHVCPALNEGLNSAVATLAHQASEDGKSSVRLNLLFLSTYGGPTFNTFVKEQGFEAAARAEHSNMVAAVAEVGAKYACMDIRLTTAHDRVKLNEPLVYYTENSDVPKKTGDSLYKLSDFERVQTLTPKLLNVHIVDARFMLSELLRCYGATHSTGATQTSLRTLSSHSLLSQLERHPTLAEIDVYVYFIRFL